jgi:hypothetical protein
MSITYFPPFLTIQSKIQRKYRKKLKIESILKKEKEILFTIMPKKNVKEFQLLIDKLFFKVPSLSI